jgi:hypothetical protein
MRFTVFCFGLALSAGAVYGGGRTLWQDGGVQLCGTSADRLIAAVSDSAGGAIVVWEDARSSPEGIYAQRVDASGVPLWTENGVLVCDSTGQTVNYVAADDGEHGVIVAWAPYRLSFGVQRVSGEGVPLWGSDGVTLRPPTDSTGVWPAFVGDGHGGVVVVWNTQSVYFQVDTLIACRVDSSGNKKWETVIRIDTLDAASPRMCADGEGGLIVAWSEPYGPVRVQRVDSVGAVKWEPGGVLACTLSTAQGAQACVAVGESCFVVGWSLFAGDVWQDRGQMFDMAGHRLWGLAGVPVSDWVRSYADAVGILPGNARQSIWIWTDDRSGADDLFAQKLDSVGSRTWDSTGIWVGTSNANHAQGWSLAGDGRGGAIAAWPLYRNSRNSDMYGQHVDSAGHLCWSDTGLAVSRDTNLQGWTPAVVTDGNGGAIVSWLEWRWGLGARICAQRVADGTGIAEAMNDERGVMNAGPSVVRGVLFLVEVTGRKPQAASLLNVCGGKVLGLHGGANDISRIAAGVYFVLEEPQATSFRPQTIRKVVIAK